MNHGTTPGAAADALELRVPGSTSNLGPGFDLLGLCVDLFLAVRARPTDGPTRVVRAAAGWPAGPDDLLVRGVERALELAGASGIGLELEVTSQVPLARGRGSSGAAVAAGLLLGAAAGRAAGGRELAREELVAPAVELEGHPDNAVASLLGGCVLSVCTASGWRTIAQPVHRSIGFAAAWPRAPLETARARAVLPRTVPFELAADNPRRLAALLEGLRTGDGELLAHGLVDHLHVPARLDLVPGAREALGAAREAGAHGATLSGSGSALFALAPRELTGAVARAMGDELARRGPLEDARELALVEGAPAVEHGPGPGW